jgi:hypothetical protein
MGGLGAIVSKKINCKFFRLTVAKTIPRGQLSHEFCRAKTKQRKRTKHEFWVKRGGFGAFVSKNSTASFFASTRGQNCPRGGFGTSFVDRNRNYENTPNMSFGSNGWIGAFVSKKSTTSFFASQRGQNVPRGRFCTSFVDRNETAKTHQT